MRVTLPAASFCRCDGRLPSQSAERLYGRGEQAELLCEVIALANPATTGPRFLCLGVSDKADFERTFLGVSRRVELDQGGPATADRAGDRAAAHSSMEEGTVGEALVSVICLDACNDQPYLFSRRVSSLIPPGSAYIP
jgi:hypothetical protein